MTDWKRADEEARERQRQLEIVTDHAPVLLAHVDAARRFRFVNRPYAERLGLHPRALVGRHVRDVLGESAYARIEPHMDAALAGEGVEYEAEAHYEGIGPQTMRVAFEPERDGDGRVVGYVAAILNITDRKRAEQELSASRQRLQAIFDNTRDAILLADDDARYVDANPAACELLGYGRDELLRLSVSDVTPLPEEEAGAALWRSFLEWGEQAGEYTAVRKDRTTAVLEYKAVANVQPGLHLSILRDVTERKHSEAVLRQNDALLHRILDSNAIGLILADFQGNVVRANDAFLGMVGHDRADMEAGRVNFVALTPPEYRHLDEQAVEQMRREGRHTPFEKEYLRRDGGRVPVLVGTAYLGGEAGEDRGIGFIIDLTEQKQAQAALRESEARFRAIVDQTVAGIAQTDLEGRLVLVNRRYCEIVGRTAEELHGLPMQDITHPDDLPRNAGLFGELVRGGRPFVIEKRYVLPDGSHVWVNNSVSLVRGEDGRPRYTVAVVLDVTERRRAEAEARESEGRFRALVTAMSDVVYRMSPDWEELQRLDGRRLVASNDRPIRGWLEKNIPPSEHDRVREAVAKAIAARGLFELEHRVIRPDSTVGWTFSRAVPILDADGEVVEWFGAASDITSRKHAEEELARVTAESERRRRLYETILSNTPDLAYVFDLEHRFTYANEGLLRMWGRTWDEAVGKNCLELGYEPWHAELHDREIEQVKATKRPIRGEVPFTGTFGRRIYDYIFVPVLGPGGEVEAVAGTTRDVTERKAMEEELRRTAAELSEASRRKDEFLATLAHELRNPLAPLRNGLQLLRLAGDDRATAGQALGMMERQLQQMVRLIDDLMDVSRITRGKLPLRKERVDLAGVVRSAVETARPLVEASAHRLTVSLPTEPVFLDADPTRLAQVFSNLLTNAAKYTERGGDLRLSAERQGGEVIVSLRDNGIGIAPEHLPHLFAMFAQVDSALERSQGGLGIGLSLVKGLTEMHGGTVVARSEGLGKGSEFVVRLPVAGGGAAPEAGDAAGPEMPRRARRVLVADDNRDAADSLAIMLRLQGHEVHAARDGLEAVEAAAWFQPELALLDIGMPRLNGYEAARRIREQPWGGSVVLVAVTGWGQAEDRRRAAESGFDEHLTKPVDPVALERLLASLPPR